MSKQESRFQKTIDQLKNQLDSSKTTDVTLPKWVDLETVRNSCCSSHENMVDQIETLKERIDTITTRLDSLNGSPAATPINHEQIALIENNIKQLKQNIAEINNFNNKYNHYPHVHNTAEISSNTDGLNRMPPRDASIQDDVKLFACFDSNGKHLNHRKLWSLKGY